MYTVYVSRLWVTNQPPCVKVYGKLFLVPLTPIGRRIYLYPTYGIIPSEPLKYLIHGS